MTTNVHELFVNKWGGIRQARFPIRRGSEKERLSLIERTAFSYRENGLFEQKERFKVWRIPDTLG